MSSGGGGGAGASAGGGGFTPNQTCFIGGNTYTADNLGRVISVQATLQRTPENIRNIGAQLQAGGEDRKEGDQGGHVVGRDMGGYDGPVNLVSMDSRINQSDYKKMENENKRALDEGKSVTMRVDMTYTGSSQRPDTITATVNYEGQTTVYTFDNNFDGGLMTKLREHEKNGSYEAVCAQVERLGGVVSSVKEVFGQDGTRTECIVNVTYTGKSGENLRKPVFLDG